MIPTPRWSPRKKPAPGQAPTAAGATRVLRTYSTSFLPWSRTRSRTSRGSEPEHLEDGERGTARRVEGGPGSPHRGQHRDVTLIPRRAAPERPQDHPNGDHEQARGVGHAAKTPFVVLARVPSYDPRSVSVGGVPRPVVVVGSARDLTDLMRHAVNPVTQEQRDHDHENH